MVRPDFFRAVVAFGVAAAVNLRAPSADFPAAAPGVAGQAVGGKHAFIPLYLAS